MRRDLFEDFCREYVRELNRLRMEHRVSLSHGRQELASVEREIRKLIQAIKDGISALSIKDELLSLEARKAELQSRLNAPEMPELLHLRRADVYREKVSSLSLALESEESRTGAVEANRARIYHVNQRALYAAIGEAESRLRKPVTLNHAIQRLMVLDAIVEDSDMVWLGTAAEKAAHLTTLIRIEPVDLPHITVGDGDGRTVRYFADRLPIGIHPAGRGVVVYVVTDPWLDEFRVFLLRHAALLRALPAWMLRIVVPPQFPDIGQRAKQVVWNQLMTPLKTEKLDELRWYFQQVRGHPAPSRSPDLDERLYRARDAFSEPRFKALYRVWKEDGDTAFAACRSHVLDEAVTTGAGRVETLELGHRYGHLSPLVAVA